jgi:ketosteroid isomerase-like protein
MSATHYRNAGAGMTTPPIDELETQLRRAMLAGDVDALEALIADGLIFVGHTGALVTKEADLETHRSRILRLIALEPSERRSESFGDTAVVTVKMHVVGEYDGATFADTYRYLRVWALVDGRWQVVAAQATEVQG